MAEYTSMSSLDYLKQTADDLGVRMHSDGIATVSDAIRLTQSVRRVISRFRSSSEHQAEIRTSTQLGTIVRHLISVGAPLETDSRLYSCGVAEWHFFDALKNLSLGDGREGDYRQTIIYTHHGSPIIITKGDPHGKHSSIVCGEILGDTRFPIGTIGTLYNAHDLRPKFEKPAPGLVVREIDEGMQFKVIRPSTLTAFPPNVRRGLLNLNSELSGAYAEVHKMRTITSLANSAKKLTEPSKTSAP